MKARGPAPRWANLAEERFRPDARPWPLPIGAEAGDCATDAVLLIGDRGMRPREGQFAFAWDMGEEWTRWTGLPFVFAMWVARPGSWIGADGQAAGAARDEGLTRLPEIARQAAPAVGIPEAECLAYLRDNLTFRLGPATASGPGVVLRDGRASWIALALRSHG